MTYLIHNFGPNLTRLRLKKGISQTDLADALDIGKQSISDYEKQKSYPTFANLDKIAQFFQATPTELFGTSTEIELEQSYLELNENSNPIHKLLKATQDIEEFSDNHAVLINDLLYLTRGKQLFDTDGEPLYENPAYPGKYSRSFEPGDQYAYGPSPLSLILQNQDLLNDISLLKKEE